MAGVISESGAAHVPGVTMRLSTAGGTVAFTVASGKSGALAAGLYLLCASQACHVRTGPQASVAAVATDLLLPANCIIGPVVIDAVATAVAAIRDSADGTLYYQRVD